MRVGQRVMLVGTDGAMPPMGAVGFIVGSLDEFGDHEVDFPAHPWHASPIHGGAFVNLLERATWEIPQRFLMPIDDDYALEESAFVRNRQKLSTGQNKAVSEGEIGRSDRIRTYDPLVPNQRQRSRKSTTCGRFV